MGKSKRHPRGVSAQLPGFKVGCADKREQRTHHPGSPKEYDGLVPRGGQTWQHVDGEYRVRLRPKLERLIVDALALDFVVEIGARVWTVSIPRAHSRENRARRENPG